MALHPVQPLLQLVAGAGVKPLQAADLLQPLVDRVAKTRRAEGINLDLNVHEPLQIFLQILRLAGQLLGHRDALDILKSDRPAPVKAADIPHRRHRHAVGLHIRRDQRLVENADLRVGGLEDLDNLIAHMINRFIRAFDNNILLVKLHELTSLRQIKSDPSKICDEVTKNLFVTVHSVRSNEGIPQ